MSGRPLPPPSVSLSRDEARLVALAAQGFSGRRGTRPSRWPAVAAVIGRMGLVQLDSVNTLVRAHYLPVYSRLGAYRRADLDRRAFGQRRRDYFEYWAHEASLLPLDFHPLLRWRMRRAERLEQGIYRELADFVRANPAYVQAVRAELAARGPLAAGDLTDPGARSGPWWGWHKGKAALEYLFWAGIVTAAGRRGFERIYDLTERAVPGAILERPTPPDDVAIRRLVGFAAGALGVATEADLRDYFRLPVADARRAVAELVEAGELVPAGVEGWRQPAFVDPAAVPARGGASALISPFDPLIWYRARAERLFGLDYRLEFYTPPAKRRFGYFVLPYLYRGRFVARIDLRSDRRERRLAVPAAFTEQRALSDAALAGLVDELRRLAEWLELDGVAVGAGGDLSTTLARRFG